MRYGLRDYTCPMCHTKYRGLELRCPNPKCEWAPDSRTAPRTRFSDNLSVTMNDPGVHESEKPMPIFPKNYGGPDEDIPKGGVKK